MNKTFFLCLAAVLLLPGCIIFERLDLDVDFGKGSVRMLYSGLGTEEKDPSKAKEDWEKLAKAAKDGPSTVPNGLAWAGRKLFQEGHGLSGESSYRIVTPTAALKERLEVLGKLDDEFNLGFKWAALNGSLALFLEREDDGLMVAGTNGKLVVLKKSQVVLWPAEAEILQVTLKWKGLPPHASFMPTFLKENPAK